MDINQTRASDHSNSNNRLAILSHRHVTITDTDPGQQSSFRHRVTILELIRFRHHRPFALECIKTNPILHRTVSHFSVKSSLLRCSFVCSGMIHCTEITHTHASYSFEESKSRNVSVIIQQCVCSYTYFFFLFALSHSRGWRAVCFLLLRVVRRYFWRHVIPGFVLVTSRLNVTCDVRAVATARNTRRLSDCHGN